MKSEARVRILGEVANEIKLSQSGVMTMNVLVTYDTPRGMAKAYIPVVFFAPESGDASQFRKGEEVEVMATVRTRKSGEIYHVACRSRAIPKCGSCGSPLDNQYETQLIGQSIKPAGDLVSKLRDELDATDLPMMDDDSIPF